MVRSFTYVLLILIACMIVPGYLLAGAQENDVLPPSVMPVVILEGSDYDMGYQYGQQAGQYIEKRVVIEWGTYARNGWSRDEVISELKACQYYIKMYAPEQIEMMQGIADGATDAGYNVSYTDVLLLNSTWAVRRQPPTATYPPAEDEDVDQNCSNFAAWGSSTKDGSLVFGGTADESNVDYVIVVVAFPDEGNAFITTCRPGELSQGPMMNNKGVIYSVGTGPTLRDVDKDYGIPWPNARQHLIRYANSAQDVVDMLLEMQVSAGLNLTIADTSGNAFVAEVTADQKAIRVPGDHGESDFIYATNNFFTEEMKAPTKGEEYGFIEHVGWARGNSVPRNKLLWNMLDHYKGNVDIEFVKMILRFPSDTPLSPPWAGWDRFVADKGNYRVNAWIPDDGDAGLCYICTGSAGRPVYPPFEYGDSGRVMTGPTHTFYELRLADRPEAVAGYANATAKTEVCRAVQLFETLNFTDTAYTVLNNLLNQAISDYYKGYIALNEGSIIGSGNEALFTFGKATSLFARAQAHALQVSEFFVPPATSPEDLGLEPWGTWEDFLE